MQIIHAFNVFTHERSRAHTCTARTQTHTQTHTQTQAQRNTHTHTNTHNHMTQTKEKRVACYTCVQAKEWHAIRVCSRLCVHGEADKRKQGKSEMT